MIVHFETTTGDIISPFSTHPKKDGIFRMILNQVALIGESFFIKHLRHRQISDGHNDVVFHLDFKETSTQFLQFIASLSSFY